MYFQEIIQQAIAIKEQYKKLEIKKCGQPWNSEQIMSGFVGDVGDLSKLVLAKEGLRDIKNVDAKLKHELADCLWAILVLANEYHIDLEKEFSTEMHNLSKRIEKELRQ
jgi:NTP pyrophosphatase (non-canonical NTP hydrolase)